MRARRLLPDLTTPPFSALPARKALGSPLTTRQFSGTPTVRWFTYLTPTRCSRGPVRIIAADPRDSSTTMSGSSIWRTIPGRSTCPQGIRQPTDDTPIQRHTYGSLVYLPHADKMFAWAGPDDCGGSTGHQYHNFWLYNLANNTWEEHLPGIVRQIEEPDIVVLLS